MKQKLLFICSVLMCFSSIAQSLTVTSLSANPAEVNSEVTVNFQYSNSNPNDIVYVGLELLNSDGSWAATIAEAFLNPLGNSGTDVTANTSFTIPANTVATSDLTNGQYYRLKVELNAENWNGWLAGDYPNFEVAAAGTLSIESLGTSFNKLVIYPNPVEEKILINGLTSYENVIISIHNILGKKIKTLSNLKTNSINVDELNSGLYLITIKNESTSKTVKFIKN